MSKKVLSLVLAFAMILGSFSFVAAESLTDIAGHWGEERIQYLFDKGVVTGHGGSGAGTFAPNDEISRAEFATMVNKALGFTKAGEVDFSDVAEGAWYYEQVAIAVEAGFVSGYTDGTFAPNQDITRQEAARMISDAYGLKQLEEIDEPFVDADDISSWAVGFVNAVKEAGFIVGDPEGTFRPQDDITRAEAASIAYEVVISLEDLEVVSVSAINGVTVEVKFSQPVDKTDLTGKVTINGVTFEAIDPDTDLSEDGKVLTLTATAPINVTNATVTVEPIKSADDGDVKTPKYVSVMTYKDTVAPTANVERVNYNTFKVKFSEPVKTLVLNTNVSAKYADGTALEGPIVLTGNNDGVSEFKVKIDDAVKVNKDIELTLNAVTDIAGNLINPQPTKLTISKVAKDEVAPKLISVTQTGAKTFNIVFDKDLGVDPTVTVTNHNVSSVEEVEGKDREYKVTVAENLNGFQTVSANATNIDMVADNSSKTITFVKDTEKPVATAKLVVNKDNEEVIELTFDKNVKAGTVTVTGSQVKDYVTTSGISETVQTVYADGTGDNKQVLHVPLTAAALKVEGAVYDVKIASTAAQVVSDADEIMKDVEFKFTRGKDGAATNQAVVDGVVVTQTDNDKVVVTFTIPNDTTLDGATATNIANYSIAGAEIVSASLDAAGANGVDPATTRTQVVTLNLKENSNTFTGVRNIIVKNVKIAGSTKVMDPVTITNVSLTENVKPTITKAELIANNQIKLTFSENITVAQDVVEVYVGTVKEAATHDAITVADNELTINITTGFDAADLAKDITVKVLANTVKDINNNFVKADTIVTVSK